MPLSDALQQLVEDQIVRGFQHVQWLSQFAIALETVPHDKGIPMTPFRAGAVNRLRMAARYIELLEREARDHARMVAGLEHEIKLLKGSDDEEDGR